MPIILHRFNKEELVQLFKESGGFGASVISDNMFKNYTCLMGEHGMSSSDQNKWLPISAIAFKKGVRIANAPRMLLDRMHWQAFHEPYLASHQKILLQQIRNKMNRNLTMGPIEACMELLVNKNALSRDRAF